MVKFKVIERLMKIGPLKGKKGYGAAPKAQDKFSQSWLIQRIVRETSLSEGDVRNVLITLRNIIIEVVTLGGALDLGDIFSLRVSMPSTFIEKEEDVTSKVLKKPGIIVTWKDNIRQALKGIEVEVDNPKQKGKKEG
ncbi:DNA-binding protein [Prevotella sp. oral taxon 475]|uniref:HU family DNA-binding protein n=1 Tax=Prevotella sp. oral taxon 475 TaxID=712471 RepID=UPI001BA9F1F2|nr:HU family DNA-binding protein [Prevotella sp. oral taxon 475]QUB47774.1 DNA-binding protein [Prevotella sp. oral taxon 475]